jgi:hypothetical protein
VLEGCSAQENSLPGAAQKKAHRFEFPLEGEEIMKTSVNWKPQGHSAKR